MFTKILVASAFTLGLATSAMAQSAGGGATTDIGNGPASATSDAMTDDTMMVDPSTTQSIFGGEAIGSGSQFSTGAIGPCGNDRVGPESSVGPNVNDQYCGK